MRLTVPSFRVCSSPLLTLLPLSPPPYLPSSLTPVAFTPPTHRFNVASVFAVDMFLTSEDEVQDRITQTMAVVFESAYELGGNVSEMKRLTYAWRLRQKFVFNAWLFKLESDVLMMFITLLTMLSTISAVLYTYFGMNDDRGTVLFDSEEKQLLAMLILLRANLLLPLVATIFRGIYASVSPMLKYVALKNAAVQLESEIYMYRCVGACVLSAVLC